MLSAQILEGVGVIAKFFKTLKLLAMVKNECSLGKCPQIVTIREGRREGCDGGHEEV